MDFYLRVIALMVLRLWIKILSGQRRVRILLPIRIMDITGKILFEKMDLDNNLKMQSVDIQSLVNGIYFIQLGTENGVLTRKVIVEK